MMKTLGWIVLLGLFGGFLGYLAGMYLACYVIWPESNLCGLVGVCVTGPLGVVAGILAGIYAGRLPKG